MFLYKCIIIKPKGLALKGNDKPYILRLFFTVLFFVICLTAFIPGCKFIAYIYHLQFAPSVCRLFISFSIFTLIIVLFHIFAAWFWGRFYCSVFCPFGILQDIIGTVLHKKSSVIPNLSVLRYFILTVVILLILNGSCIILRFFDPYSIFGSIISSFLKYKTTPLLVGVVPLFVIIILVFWKNRIFCTSLCPVGTALGLCAKIGFNKLNINKEKCKKCGMCSKNCPTGAVNLIEQKIDNERCIRCLRCVGFCAFEAIDYGKQTEKLSFDKSRRTFISAAVILSAATVVFAKGKDTFLYIIHKFKNLPILPPGAVSAQKFTLKCTSCGLCTIHCKGNVIEKPNSEFQTIHLNYKNGKCEFDCKNCSDICPTGALQKMSLQQKQHCRIAMAVFNTNDCIKCGQCISSCPKNAVLKDENDFPKLDASLCIGCGACQNICPVKCVEVSSIIKQSKTF